MVQVFFYSLPYVDPSNQHVFNFKNKNNQVNYFNRWVKHIGNFNMKIEPLRSTMVVNKPYSWFIENNINYVSSFDSSGKNIYYFINDFEYSSEHSTRVILLIDVFQTYMFDYEILESFVDRCHVNRWDDDIPTKEYESEDINYGENILVEYEDIYQMNNGVVFASTVPLGQLQTSSNGGTENGTCGDWQNGVMSSNGFRFMKGYEGFGEYRYIDSGGVPTIGYGVTMSEPTQFNDLVSKQPVDEEYASKISYELKQKNYGKPIVDFCKQIGVTKQNQFDALCDLAFNAGVGAVLGTPSYTSLPNALKTDPFNESYIRPIWESYLVRDDSGTPQQGLVSRRKAECDIYFKNIYEFRPIVTIDANGRYGPPITQNDDNGWLPTCEKVEGIYVNNKAGDNWLLPCRGELTGLYPSYPSGNPHNGLDIGCPVGTDVRASKDGVVLDRQELTTSYGYFLKIQHDDSVVIYGHNSELFVQKGERVKQGQVIAKSGNTGNSFGPHCHFEIRNDRVGEVIQHGVKTVNPYPQGKLGEKV